MTQQGAVLSFVALRTRVWLGALERWLFDCIFRLPWPPELRAKARLAHGEFRGQGLASSGKG